MGMLYYYIMVDPDKPDKCKLGITTDPSSRIKAYKTAAPNCYFYRPKFELPFGQLKFWTVKIKVGCRNRKFELHRPRPSQRDSSKYKFRSKI